MSQRRLWGLNLMALRLPRRLEWDSTRGRCETRSRKMEMSQEEERTIEPSQKVTRFQPAGPSFSPNADSFDFKCTTTIMETHEPGSE